MMQYIIRCGTAQAVVTSRSAELISFQKDGQEYVWTGDPTYWGGHNPILFPAVCRAKNNVLVFDGVAYPFEKHGFARKSEFALAAQGEDFVSLVLCDNEQTRSGFPFHFKLTVTHRVTQDSFITSYRVDNLDEREMAFLIGGHTGILLDFGGCRSIEGWQLKFEQVEHADVYYGDENLFIQRHLKYDDILNGSDTVALTCQTFDRDELMIEGLKSKRVRLISPSGKGVEMDFGDFPVLGVWTPPKQDAPFVCLEPWHGMPSLADESGEMRERPHAIVLDAGENKELSYRLRVL